MALTEQALRSAFRDIHRDWDQWCQAFVYRAAVLTGGAVQPYPSAIDAYHRSIIASTSPGRAPLGAIHYWAIGKYGHVAVGLGGSTVVMASRHADGTWGTNAGITTVAKYSAKTGARYLGWSHGNGRNIVKLTKATAPHPSKGRKQTTVKAGEGGIRVAERVGISYDRLRALNPKVDDWGALKVGQRVWIS